MLSRRLNVLPRVASALRSAAVARSGSLPAVVPHAAARPHERYFAAATTDYVTFDEGTQSFSSILTKSPKVLAYFTATCVLSFGRPQMRNDAWQSIIPALVPWFTFMAIASSPALSFVHSHAAGVALAAPLLPTLLHWQRRRVLILLL
jgi:hypothetical protein